MTRDPATRGVSVAYFYRVRWGALDEFIELFERNHWPILREQPPLPAALAPDREHREVHLVAVALARADELVAHERDVLDYVDGLIGERDRREPRLRSHQRRDELRLVLDPATRVAVEQLLFGELFEARFVAFSHRFAQ